MKVWNENMKKIFQTNYQKKDLLTYFAEFKLNSVERDLWNSSFIPFGCTFYLNLLVE